MKKAIKIVLAILLIANVAGTGYLCFERFFNNTAKYETAYTASHYSETVTLELKRNSKFTLTFANEKIISGDFSISKENIDFTYIFGFTADNADTDTISGVTVREIIDSGTIKKSNGVNTIKVKFSFIEFPELIFKN